MRRLFVLLNCTLAAAVGTLALATANILYLMFSTKEPGSNKTGMWGSVSFESIKNPDGSLSVEAGVSNWVPLAGIWVLATVVLFVIYLTHKWLKAYKKSLVESAKGV